MDYLVFLNARAGELEKILSGVKSMVVKELDPAGPAAPGVCPGDSLYFLRNTDEGTVRVKATVVRVLFLMNGLNEELSQTLKEMQPRLQLTEEQYNRWSAKQQVLLVEFGFAQKMGAMHIPAEMITDRPDWIALEAPNLISELR